MAEVRELRPKRKQIGPEIPEPPPPTPPDNAEAIRILEAALEKAKAGAITGVCLISMGGDEVEMEHTADTFDLFSLLGHLEYLKLLLVYGEDEDED